MPSTCPHCGIGFNKWEDYKDHMPTHVKETYSTTIKPIRTTKRTKQQIVDDVESSWLGQHIISTGLDVHLEACKCIVCWNKKLDELIASQEAAIKEQSCE